MNYAAAGTSNGGGAGFDRALASHLSSSMTKTLPRSIRALIRLSMATSESSTGRPNQVHFSRLLVVASFF
jgi:hypothetical protein